MCRIYSCPSGSNVYSYNWLSNMNLGERTLFSQNINLKYPLQYDGSSTDCTSFCKEQSAVMC